MERRSPPQKRIDDQAFPVRVKVRVPGRGFENLLLDLHRLSGSKPKRRWASEIDISCWLLA